MASPNPTPEDHEDPIRDGEWCMALYLDYLKFKMDQSWIEAARRADAEGWFPWLEHDKEHQ